MGNLPFQLTPAPRMFSEPGVAVDGNASDAWSWPLVHPLSLVGVRVARRCDGSSDGEPQASSFIPIRAQHRSSWRCQLRGAGKIRGGFPSKPKARPCGLERRKRRLPFRLWLLRAGHSESDPNKSCRTAVRDSSIQPSRVLDPTPLPLRTSSELWFSGTTREFPEYRGGRALLGGDRQDFRHDFR